MAILSLSLFMVLPMEAQRDSTKVHGKRHGKHIDKEMKLDEVVVVAGGVSRVKKSAFNTIAVDTREMQNTTKNLSDALSKAPGQHPQIERQFRTDIQERTDLRDYRISELFGQRLSGELIRGGL